MTLHYSDTQVSIGIAFAVIVVALVALFVVVGLNSRRDVPFPVVQKTAYWIRRRWLAILIVLMVAFVGGTMLALPYSRGAANALKVRVVGGQFYWSISPDTFKQGDSVRFEVTSQDVNHGFGIYSPSGKMIGSVQAMPDYTNRLAVDLDEAGTYTIECLEFCGVGHHKMEATFQVDKR